MKKNIILGLIFTAIVGYAQIALGASGALFDSSSNLSGIISNIIKLFNNSVIPLLVAAAVVVFLWGVVVFIAKSSAGNVEARKEGINLMIYGIIGIAVMVSVWGLVSFVTTTFGTNNGIPQFYSTSSQGVGGGGTSADEQGGSGAL